MALIACQQCRKRISSLAEQCPHCGYSSQLSQSGSAADLAALRLKQLKLWRYRVRMGSYTAMALMLAAVIAWWLDSGMLGLPGLFVKLALASGLLVYMSLRAYLFWLSIQIKSASKALREAEN
ncbi:MAG: hypothetical protein PF630_10325 [Gammaproteobacteria bacterium]|jgi:hypothetical protein|nr:hypothetical protein [Gammaproteobacteria bacterium]